MNLLNIKVYNSQEFKELQLILKNLYIENSNNPVFYNELNDAIVSFVTKIMFSYLEDTEFRSDSFSCIIKKLPSSLKGTFDDENNVITISEEVINDIYNFILPRVIIAIFLPYSKRVSRFFTANIAAQSI